MSSEAKLAERLSPPALILFAITTLLWLVAFGLAWTTRNEFEAGTGFREAIRNYGTGDTELLGTQLPEVIQAKPKRYPYPKLLYALLLVRSGTDLAKAEGLFRETLDEPQTLLTPKEKALCLNGLGVAGTAILRSQAKGAHAGSAFRPPAAARDAFEAAAEAWPDLPEGAYNLAVWEFANGRPEQARKRMEEALEASKLPPSLDLARNLKLAGICFAERKGDWGAAVTEAKQLMMLRPSGTFERLLFARTLARQTSAGPLPDGAPGNETPPEAAVQNAGGERGEMLDRVRGECWLRAAVWRMEGYRATVESKTPISSESWYILRRMIESAFDQAQAFDPKCREIQYNRCAQLARDLLYKKTAQDTNALIAGVEPRFAALAKLEGAPPRAVAAAETARGIILVMGARLPDAVVLFEHAAALEPDNAAALRNLAVAYDRSGDRVKAAAWYEKSLAKQPGHPQAQARLASLRAAEPTKGAAP